MLESGTDATAITLEDEDNRRAYDYQLEMWADSTYRELILYIEKKGIEKTGPIVKIINPPLDIQIAVQNAFIKSLEDPRRQVHVWWYTKTNEVHKIAISKRE